MLADQTLRVHGSVIVYRLHDVAYTLDLERTAQLLAPSSTARVRPARAEAQALQIKNPPVDVLIATTTIQLLGTAREVAVSARLFDFGVCSLRAEIAAPADSPWSAYAEFAAAASTNAEISGLFDRELAALIVKLAPAAERPAVSRMTESYTIFRVTAGVAPAALTDDVVAPLLLREPRAVSVDARRKLLPHRFSYYTDDLAILTWESALIVDPESQEGDVEYVLEFANAQLLQLRVYDETLDDALPAMYDSVAAARARRGPLVRRRYRPVLSSLQTLVADVTETVEHSDNAFKITDDVYLADIYETALRLFRSAPWRAAIERKLSIVRETYTMLDAEAQESRAEVLEIVIVVLILAEFIRSLF